MKVTALNANNTVWGTWDGVREWSLRSPHLWIQYDNGDSDMVDLPASVVGVYDTGPVRTVPAPPPPRERGQWR